ncbi:MAG: transporter substrate-binding domain-containing protein, partial [Candidatus Pacebacteria bacterium]|nr:transporter substrate-binding domain-containing protein [Candidatus Paceibacterota bacterium]
MKKQFLVLVFIILLSVFFVYINKQNNLRILTEEYKPLQYINKDGEIDGYAVRIVKDILNELNISKEIELIDWDTAYNLALNEDNIVLFSTIKNKERKDEFKWVGPIGTLKVNLYAKVPNDIKIESLDKAKKYKISAVKDYAYTQNLKNLGFDNIVECDTEIEALKKLLSDETDLYLTSNIAINELADAEMISFDMIQ